MDLGSHESIVAYTTLWTPIVTVWMVTWLIIGQVYWRRRVAPSRIKPSRFAVRWREVEENPTLVILLAVAVLSLWQASLISLTGDEANNIEPHFWSRWYLAPESRSSPPLFRAMIHLPTPVQHRLMMRLPAVAAGVGALVVLYHMLRRRSSPAVAQWLLGAVASSSLLLGYSVEQKSYTLWLLLLLACHRCLSSALRGREQMWGWFSLFAALAMLTHYLSIAWLAGYLLWSAWRSREDLPNLALALLPGAMAVAPMVVPILSQNESVSEGPGIGAAADWISLSLPAALVPGGVIGAAALFMLRPVDHEQGTHQADAALPWITGAGLAGTIIAASGGSIESRFLMPMLPMAVLAAAGRMPKPMRDWGRGDRVILATVALLSLGTGLARIGPIAVAPATNPIARALERLAEEEPPNIRIVHPVWMLHVALYEVSSKRNLLHGAKGDELMRSIVEVDGLRWATLRQQPEPEVYDQVAAKYGTFELWSLAGPHKTKQKPPIKAWTNGVCKQLVKIGTPERTVPGPWAHVWRCRARPRAAAAP